MGNRGRGAPTRRGRPSRRRRPLGAGAGRRPSRGSTNQTRGFDQLSVPHARAGGRGARGALAPGGGSGFFGGARFARGGGRGAARRRSAVVATPRVPSREEKLWRFYLSLGADARSSCAPRGSRTLATLRREQRRSERRGIRPPRKRRPSGVEGLAGRSSGISSSPDFPRVPPASRGFQPERGERDRRGGASPPRRPRAPDADARSDARQQANLARALGPCGRRA